MRWLGLVLLLAGCPRGGARTAADVTIEELREEAEAHPRDASLQAELAHAEMFWSDGDPARVQAQVERALELQADNPQLLFIAGLDSYLHGKPASALQYFVSTLEQSEDQADLAEVAASGVEELLLLTPVEAMRPRIEAALPQLSAGARQTLTDVLVELAYRRGDIDAVNEAAEEMRCVTSWRVAGPFGPRDLLGFDRSFAAEALGPLADEYDLGPNRGTRTTRTVEGRGCAAHLGEGPVTEGGTTYAEGLVDIDRAGEYTLRIETPNSVELRVDGERLVRLDHRRNPLRRVSFHNVELSAGRHEIEVKVTTRHPNPILMVSLARGASAESNDSSEEDPTALGCYVRASLQLSRGATVAAREAIRACAASPTRWSLEAAIALLDPFRNPDMRRDEARRLLTDIRRKDADAWYPALQLARLKAAEGRDQEAIADLRRIVTRWPELSTVPLFLAELLLNRGWNAQGKIEIERALAAAPGTCPPVEAALAEARQRDAVEEIDVHIERVMNCDARNSARFANLVQARRWRLAAQELHRLAALQPAQARGRLLPSQLDLAEGQRSAEQIDRTLAELAQWYPRSDSIQLARVDRRIAEANRDGALELLDELTRSEPEAMLRLRRIRTALGGRNDFEGFRLDGAAAVREFEASGRHYDQPQVLVLDYTVQRVLSDGSSLALTHQIYRLQSEEAVDAQGEFAPPDGGYLLKLQTIKADGRRLEPDLIDGKETISLPNLAIGDYVESEYIVVLDPPAGIPGGVMGDRFYFASFEVPFDRSELVVIAPADMEVVVDPRGPAPETQRERNRNLQGEDVQVLRWRVDQSAALTQEPLSVATREFIPSINWGIGATWGSFLEGLRDALADRDMVDPEAQHLVDRLVDGAESDREKARRIYYWLLDNVENNNDVFGSTAAMLADRNGNRSRLLHYFLGLAGVDSELILARGFSSDQTRSELADSDTYRNLLVRIGDDVLMTASKGIPYGYISPALRGQDALVLTPFERSNEVRRIEMPAPLGQQDERSIEIDVEVGEDGSGTVEVVESFSGANAIQWRSDLEGIPQAVLNQRFEEGYVARLIPGARLTSLTIEGQDNPEERFVLRYAMQAPSLAHRQGEQLTIPGLYATMLAARYAQAGSRTTPQIVGPPLHIEVAIRIRNPGGAPQTDFSPVELRAGAAYFGAQARTNGSTLEIRRELHVPLSRVAPEDYPAFAAFCRGVDEAEARQIRIR